MQNFNLPAYGAGAGLRPEHFSTILERRPPFPWFEIISENFMDFGGALLESLTEIGKQYRLIGHGVCLSVGSTDPLDIDYLHRLRAFLDRIGSPWASDHLCFTMVDHTNLNDLIPLPFTNEAVRNVVERIKIAQDILQRPFLVENVTRYITVSSREMSEAEFISTILEQANCGLLLDITNAYLNGTFHHFDPLEFIRSLPLERVGQMHLSGWEPGRSGEVIDSHDAPVPEPVWKLFQEVIQLTGPSSVLIEWDDQLPKVDRLLQEVQMAGSIIAQTVNHPLARAVGEGA